MQKQNSGTAAEISPAAPAEEFDLGSLLGYRLVRLSSAIGALAEQEAQEVAGLTLPEYRVLTVLHSLGPTGVVSLQRAMRIDKAWISRTLAKLVDKRLVASGADNQDGRRSLFRVTAKGKSVAQALIERAVIRQARIFQGFEKQEVITLISLLSRIQGNVEVNDGQDEPRPL